MPHHSNDETKSNLLGALPTRVLVWLSLILCILAIVVYVAFTEPKNTKTPQAPKPGVTPAIQSLPTVNPAPSPSPIDLSALPAEQPIPILMYHYIRENPDPNDKIGAGLSVTPATFLKHLIDLKTAGYTAITFDDLHRPLPPKPVILTFDDGYDDAYTEAFRLLSQEQMVGVFYIVTDFLDIPRYVTTAQIKEIAMAGHEIGSHTVKHRNLAALGEDRQQAELTESKQKLETILGKPVVSFCYPSGKYNEVTLRIAKEVGYTTATTTKPGIARGIDFAQKPFELQRIRVTNRTDILKEVGQ